MAINSLCHPASDSNQEETAFVGKRGPSRRRRSARKGSLTIEWIVLVTLLCVGILGALGVVRNALILEFHELTESICETDVLDEQVGPLVEPEPGP
jgi:hypothetical protein